MTLMQQSMSIKQAFFWSLAAKQGKYDITDTD